MENFLIENLEKDDYYKGYLQLLEQLTVVNPDKISYNDFCLQFDQINSNNNYKIIVIRNENKIIGTGSIFLEKKFTRGLTTVGHIEDVVIDEKFRGFKLGKKIIDYLVNFAKINGCYKVILNCSDKNVDFYKKCGFVNKNKEMSLYFN